MRHQDLLLAGLVWLAVLLGYAATMPTVLPASGDARHEIARAAADVAEPDPRHLVLTPVYARAVRWAERAPIDVRPHVAIQLVNALAGATAAAVFLLLCLRLGARPPIAAAAAIALAVTHAHWLHSREAETGILAQLLLIGSLFVAAGLRETVAEAHGPSPARVAARAGLAGGLVGLASLFSLVTAIAVPATAVLAFQASPRWRRGAVAALLAGVLAVIVAGYGGFLACGGTEAHPLPGGDGVVAWLTAHPSAADMPDLGRLLPSSFARAGSGAVNGFVGHSALTTAVKQVLRREAPVAVPAADAVRFALGAVIALGLVAAATVRVPGRTASAWRQATAVATASTLALAVMWLGSDPQFWLPWLPFAWAQVAIVAGADPEGVGRLRPGVPVAYRGFLISAIVVMLMSNLRHPTPTWATPTGGDAWRAAESFAATSGTADLLLHAGAWGPYAAWLGAQSTRDLLYDPPEGDFLEGVQAEVRVAVSEGGTVYALEIFDPGSPDAVGRWDKIGQRQGVTRSDVVTALQAMGRWHRVAEAPGDAALWRLERR